MKLIKIDDNGDVFVIDGDGNEIQITDSGSLAQGSIGALPTLVEDSLASDFVSLAAHTTFTDSGLEIDLNLLSGQLVEIEAYGQANAVSAADDKHYEMRLQSGATTLRESENNDSDSDQYRTPAFIKFSGLAGTDITVGAHTVKLQIKNDQGTDIDFKAGFTLLAKVYG